MTEQQITFHVAATTLWHFHGNRYGNTYPGSDWRRQLIALIARSDPGNRGKLALGFPGEVVAVDLCQTGNVAPLLEIVDQDVGMKPKIRMSAAVRQPEADV